MNLGIMQPYFFPYLGYWQLLNAVDEYVIYDDVNYIKNGWINRNRILIQGDAHYFTLPLEGASSYSLINQIRIANQKESYQKMLKTLQIAYGKAPFFPVTYDLVSQVFNESTDSSLLQLLVSSHKHLCDLLQINTKLLLSSSIAKQNELHGKEKVIELCKILGATGYYNAIGGKALYSKEDFLANGIGLKFLHSNDVLTYRQYKNVFVPNLSIIDVLMFNGVEQTKLMLLDYSLE